MPIEAPQPSLQPATRSADARIAEWISALVVVVIFVGFAKNFYLRAWLGTRPLILTAWVHGIVMSAWLVLFAIQLSMVSRRRLKVHRKLGQWSIWLAVPVVAVGIVTIFVRTRIVFPQATSMTSALVFVAFDGLSLLLFGALVALAWAYRLVPAAHRRLMVMAMVALLPPAYGRTVEYVRRDHIEIIVVGLMVATTLMFVVVDARRSHRVQPASWIPGLLIVLVSGVAYAAQVSI